MKVESPCNNICKLDVCDVCIGCLRTADEIARWAGYSNAQKQQVIEKSKMRTAIEAKRA